MLIKLLYRNDPLFYNTSLFSNTHNPGMT